MEDHSPPRPSHPPVHRTRVLKLEPSCCTECVRKVKRAMLKAEGVDSIKVNAKDGTIEVTSEIDPQVLIEMAAKAGKRAELLWDPEQESSENIPMPTPPKPESSENIPTPTSPLATSSTGLANERQVLISSLDHSVDLQDLVDKNGRGIRHMEIIDKRVIKITFMDPHDDPSANLSPDPPSQMAPLSSDAKGGGSSGEESKAPDCCGNVEVAAAPAEPPYSIPPEFSDAPCNKGGGEANSSDCCGNVEVVAAPAKPPHSIPSEISDAPCNSKPLEPPVAYVNCSNGWNRCRVM